jgi:hypothetical protein
MAASLRSFLSRSGTLPRQDRFPSASFGFLGFAFHSQARQDTRPNRVPHVRTDRLASGCSPPHLRGPRLLIPFGDAVTFGFQPVELLVERDLTSFSDALSGARVRRLAAALGNVQRSGSCHATQSGSKPHALQSAPRGEPLIHSFDEWKPSSVSSPPSGSEARSS